MTLARRVVLGSAALVLAGCGSSGDAPESTRSSPAAFRDGTYTAEGEYGGQPSHIGVELTLDDGIVTDVKVETRATDPTSLDLQRRFADAVPSKVVGRPIADLNVGKTAGSSGTLQGFNDALEQIRRAAGN